MQNKHDRSCVPDAIAHARVGPQLARDSGTLEKILGDVKVSRRRGNP